MPEQLTAQPTPVAASASEPTTAPVAVLDASIPREISDQLYGAFGPQQQQEPARDAQGRFISHAPEAEAPPLPAPIKLDAVWKEAAKREFFTDEQISAFKTDQDLVNAVNARRMELAQRWAPIPPGPMPPQQDLQQPAPVTAAPATTAVYDDLKLALNDNELAEEVVQPIKAMAEYVNKLKATLVAENDQLRRGMVQLYGAVGQSVQASQAMQAQQFAAQLDRMVETIPGFVEFAGKPSETIQKPGTPQYERLSAIGGVVSGISAKYANVLGPQALNDHRIITQILQEAFEVLNPSMTNNGTVANNGKQFPGAVVRQVAQRSSGVEPGPTGTPSGQDPGGRPPRRRRLRSQVSCAEPGRHRRVWSGVAIRRLPAITRALPRGDRSWRFRKLP